MENKLIEKYTNEPRWVNWRYSEKNGRQTKVPLGKSNDPLTWRELHHLNDQKHIGFMFGGDNKFLGIDIDHCIKDGEIDFSEEQELVEFIKEANTYTEISPSGTGLHVYFTLSDELILKRNKKALNKVEAYECYSSGRYFTVTSNSFGEPKDVRTITPEEAVTLLEIIGYPWKKPTEISTPDSSRLEPLSDIEVTEMMFSSSNGQRIQSLYSGDLSKHDDNHSSADMALCSHLAFWTNKDREQMERIWTNSPLGLREKTQTRKDYRDLTINNAADTCTETYSKMVKVDDSNKESSLKTNFVVDSKTGSLEVARHLIRKYHVKTFGDRIREVYVYRDGYYTAGVNLLKADIQTQLEELASTHHKNNIMEMIKDLTHQDKPDFDKNKHLINLNNGVYDLKSRALLPHSHKYEFFTKIPIDYDSSAECPTISNFLEEILNKDDKVTVIQWLGYSMYRSYYIKKAIIFVGEKNTGKSTLLNVFSRFIGKANISGVSLQNLSADKFASANLYNKHMNVFDDLSFKDINDNGSFKIATGGGLMSGERKFGDQFQFENFAKLTFACNKIPDVKDANDNAYFSRWILIHFSSEIKKIDKFLTEKMTTDEELSGLLNLALEGLVFILENQNFSYNKSSKEIKEDMLMSGSMIAKFIYECLEKEDGSWVSKDEMYELCAEYSQRNDLPIVEKTFLGRKIPNHSGYIIDGTKSQDGKQVRGWKNVKIKRKGNDR